MSTKVSWEARVPGAKDFHSLYLSPTTLRDDPDADALHDEKWANGFGPSLLAQKSTVFLTYTGVRDANNIQVLTSALGVRFIPWKIQKTGQATTESRSIRTIYGSSAMAMAVSHVLHMPRSSNAAKVTLRGPAGFIINSIRRRKKIIKNILLLTRSFFLSLLHPK